MCPADPALTFKDLLAKVDEALLAALNNSAVPFTQARSAQPSAPCQACLGPQTKESS